MKPSVFKDFLSKTHKAYSHIARFSIENNKLVLINKLTGSNHIFVTGETEMKLDADKYRIAQEFIKNH